MKHTTKKSFSEKINEGYYENNLTFPSQNSISKFKNDTAKKIQTLKDAVDIDLITPEKGDIELEKAKFSQLREEYSVETVRLNELFENDLLNEYGLDKCNNNIKNKILEISRKYTDGTHNEISRIVNDLSNLCCLMIEE